jgi:hypothetical protein
VYIPLSLALALALALARKVIIGDTVSALTSIILVDHGVSLYAKVAAHYPSRSTASSDSVRQQQTSLFLY